MWFNTHNRFQLLILGTLILYTRYAYFSSRIILKLRISFLLILPKPNFIVDKLLELCNIVSGVILMNRIHELRVASGISMKQAAAALEMPYTTYVNYEKGLREPSYEVLIRLANHYNVSIDYLIGHSPEKQKAPVLNSRDERDIARDLERMMAQLDNGGDLMFDGNPMSDEAKASIRNAIQLGLEAAKVKNKERFTPKKYRKG